MSSFTEIKLQPISHLNKLSNAVYLVLTSLQSTPPHCSLICNKKWYSLNYNECKINISVNTLFKLLLLKNEPSVFLELSIELKEKIVEITFSQYKRINFQDGITCIAPIKEILVAHNVPFKKDILLYEMIELLYQEHLIQKSFSFIYSANIYKIKKYSKEELLKTTT